MKYVVVAIIALFAIALGVAAIVYGEADDSPGGQLIGVLLIVGALVLGVRMVRRNR
jgi:drug/metabolite transporter (DMT)-like permease